MPFPDQFRTSPIVVGVFGILLFLGLFGLGGCDTPVDQPYRVCLQESEPYIGNRGVIYRTCIRHGLACISPLILDTKDGKLFCRLREPGDLSNTQG